MYYNNNNHSSSFRSSSQQHATYIDRNNKTLRIQKHLGSGVFGNVYKAYETNTGNEYAIKMTKYNNIEPEKGINEIQILKYLQHYNDIDQKNKEHGNNNNNNNNNNIIKFINSFIYRVKNNDYESTNNDKNDKVHNEFLSYRCIVMDYVGPFTLRDALNKGYITDVIQYNNNNINRTNYDDRYTIKQVMKDILSAVTFMHSLNITHRDIKPENIICQISSNRIVRVVLADFGCGKMLTYNSNENHILLSTTSNNNNNQLVTSSSLLRTNMMNNGHDDDHSVNKNIDENIHKQYPKSNPVVCTRLYRSPELLLGSSYCVLASDMFSIGIMFGEMMLGHDKYLITSTTFEEHLLKMFLLFNHLPSKQDLIDMHLDAPAIAFSNDNDDKEEEEKDETKFDSTNNNIISSYTEYLYEELNYSFSQYFDHTNNTFIVNNKNKKKKDSIDNVNTVSDYRNQSNVMDVDGDNRIHVNVPSWYIDVPFIYHADEMNAMELLQHLLLYSPIQRMKGADALKHSFLCG